MAKRKCVLQLLKAVLTYTRLQQLSLLQHTGLTAASKVDPGLWPTWLVATNIDCSNAESKQLTRVSNRLHRLPSIARVFVSSCSTLDTAYSIHNHMHPGSGRWQSKTSSTPAVTSL